MTCDITFTVEDETAKAIIEDIDEAIQAGDDSWEFHGDFTTEEATSLRNRLAEQLD